MVNLAVALPSPASALSLSRIVVGFQVEGTGAIGIDRNTRVDVGIERFIERDRGIIAVG